MTKEENKYALAQIQYTLPEKIEMCKKCGIDYLGNVPGVTLEQQRRNIQEILWKILTNPELLKKFDKIESEFWQEVMKIGLLIYKEAIFTYSNEPTYLDSKSQSCIMEQTFTTVSGKEVCIGPLEDVPTLVYQIKK